MDVDEECWRSKEGLIGALSPEDLAIPLLVNINKISGHYLLENLFKLLACLAKGGYSVLGKR